MSDEQNKVESGEDVQQTSPSDASPATESNLQQKVVPDLPKQETFEQVVSSTPDLLQQLKEEMLKELKNEVQVYLSPALNYAAQQEAERIKHEISSLLPSETNIPDLLDKWREANQPLMGHFESNPSAIPESVVRYFKASQYDTLLQSLTEQKQMSNQFTKTNELRTPVKNEFAGSRLIANDAKGSGLSDTLQRIFERNTNN